MKDTLNLMKSLSDEIRVRIINLLFQSDLYVCEIVEILNLPQSTVSRHLIVLKNANIVSNNKEGLWIKYSLNKNEGYFIIKDIVTNNLINDEKCIKDLEKLKNIINSNRGCENKS